MSLPLSNGNVAQEVELSRAYVGEVVAEKMIARAMEKTREEVLEAYDAFGLNDDDLELLCLSSFYEHLKDEREHISKAGQLAAAGTAWVGSLDIQTAADTAKLAVEYNAIGSILKDLWETISGHYRAIQVFVDKHESICCLIPGSALIALEGKIHAGQAITTIDLFAAGLELVPIPGAGAISSKLAIKAGGKEAKAIVVRAGKGPYKQVGGHHPHAQAAFRGHPKYNPGEAFAISKDLMTKLGANHEAVTKSQRKLYKQLEAKGTPLTIKDHTWVAVEALVENGVARETARKFVAEDLQTLKNMGVKEATRIPWGKN